MIEPIKERLEKLVLNPKKEKLISGLINVVTGKEPSYRPGVDNPQYFEIWFYTAFDFNYVVIGWNNFAINLANPKDSAIIEETYQAFKKGFEDELVAEDAFIKMKKTLEFSFFRNCWAAVEDRIKKKGRCFLIEYSALYGIDVNHGINIDAAQIKGVLKKENIPYHG